MLTDSGHLSPTPIGRIRPARLAGAFCVLAGPPDASFQGSLILNSSIARFVAVAVSGASVRGRAIGRALMLPPVRARLARVFATRLSRLSWRDMGFRDRSCVHDSGRMGNSLILGFLAVATAAAIRASIPGAGGAAAVLAELPRHAATASGRAVGGRDLPTASGPLRGSARINGSRQEH